MNKKIKRNLLIFKYIGPGILVTVGFIDPGNWAANLAAGSLYSYSLLWMVTLSTIMLILLQYNVAKLGIVTGHCLAENTYQHLTPFASKSVLFTGTLAAISTAIAEILGAGIAIEILFGVPLKVAIFLVLAAVVFVIFLNSYHRIEKIIISFVSIIGFAFFYETTLFHIDWQEVGISAVTPSFPKGSLLIIVSVLGAVVMPHNLFLHSEIVQSRNWYKRQDHIMSKLMKFQFFDTFFAMLIGWAINSVIIILAAEVFFKNNIEVSELNQASELLRPILGNMSGIVFAVALLFAGFASSITAGMAGGSIFSGMFKQNYNPHTKITKYGIWLTLVVACIFILFIKDPLEGLIYSQVFLSMQLPFTIFLQIYLTSSKKIMGKYANSKLVNSLLWVCGIFISVLNIVLLYQIFTGA
jgi:manganese transport protein